MNAAKAPRKTGGARSGVGPLLVLGADDKTAWEDSGKLILASPGNDSVMVYDLADREDPRLLGQLTLENSVIGPPIHVGIHPSGKFALVTNPLNNIPDGAGGWKWAADNKVNVVDITASPPRLMQTVEVGKWPSGLSISPDGTMALVAARDDNAVSVLSIKDDHVAFVENVPLGDSIGPRLPPNSQRVLAVLFAPDGKRAFAIRQYGNDVVMLEVAGGQVTNTNYLIPAGVNPTNGAITPDGKLLLTTGKGRHADSDGHIDSMTVIDLEFERPKVIDHVAIGDGPEGIAISPRGDLVAIVNMGSVHGKASPLGSGVMNILKREGSKFTRLADIEVGNIPQVVEFSPEGAHLYVTNFFDQLLRIYRVKGTKVTDTGKSVRLGGRPAAGAMTGCRR